MEWRLADAKNRFSELVNRSLTDGPQRVLRRGDAVMVVSEHDYQRLGEARQVLRHSCWARGRL